MKTILSSDNSSLVAKNYTINFKVASYNLEDAEKVAKLVTTLFTNPS